MDCLEVKQKLHELVDRELSAAEALKLERHIDRCLACRDARAALLQLKRLVREKAPRPEVPAHLRARLLRRGRPRWMASRRPLLAAAALLVGGALLGVFIYQSFGQPRLTHAAASAGCVEVFRGLVAEAPPAASAGGTSDPAWEDRVRSEVHRLTGADIDRLPRVLNAEFAQCSRQTVRGVSGVRVDFVTRDVRPQWNDKEAVQAGPGMISLFLLPLDSMAFDADYLHELERGHSCMSCIEMEDGSIYCFTVGKVFFSAVSDLPEEALWAHLRLH